MAQLGAKLYVNGRYFKHPIQEILNYANVAVFNLPRGLIYLDAYDQNKMIYQSPIKRERENFGRCELKAGQTYVIVCSSEVEGVLGEF